MPTEEDKLGEMVYLTCHMTFELFFVFDALTELLALYPKVTSMIWKEVVAQERPELIKGPFGIWKNIVGV